MAAAPGPSAAVTPCAAKIQDLDQKQIDADLDAAVAYAGKLNASNGKVVVGGFC